MLNFLKNKSDQSHSLFLAIKFILSHSNVRFNEWKVLEELEKNVYFPSMLCVNDVLNLYGIQSGAIRKGEYQYDDFETPYLCTVQEDDWPYPHYVVVTEADQKIIKYIHPNSGRSIEATLDQFNKIDKGVILLIDNHGKIDELDYRKNRYQFFFSTLYKRIPVICTVLIILSYLFFQASDTNIDGILRVYILSASIIGLLVSCLLIWYDIDSHNSFIREVCGGGGGVNCEAVLSSSGATLFGLSWSMLGASYFFTIFAFQIFYPVEYAGIYLWAFASIIVSPYILYSLYYQWKIVKQWCTLCLAVQGVLIINVIVLFLQRGLLRQAFLNLSFYQIALAVLVFMIITAFIYLNVPVIKKARDAKEFKKRFDRLRFHPEVFNTILSAGNLIKEPVGGLGIVIGNPEASREIVKVCNPYCDPCAKAHPILEDILRLNKEVRLRIIFTGSDRPNDRRTAPVKHFLAIEQNYGREKLAEALQCWYAAPEKNIEAFQKKFPIEEYSLNYIEKMKDMQEWCTMIKIRATPTIFIDNFELPSNYDVNDLKSLF